MGAAGAEVAADCPADRADPNTGVDCPNGDEACPNIAGVLCVDAVAGAPNGAVGCPKKPTLGAAELVGAAVADPEPTIVEGFSDTDSIYHVETQR